MKGENMTSVIAVDFDDVVCDFNWKYIDHHNETYGDPRMTREKAHTFDMAALYGITPDEVVKRVRNFCTNHHGEIKLHRGADRGLHELSRKHELHIVTSRCESFRETTMDWMEEKGVLGYFSGLHFTNGFGTLFPERKRTKLQVCEKIQAIALIEDSPGNAHIVADGGIPVVVPEYAWNTGKLDHDRIHVVNDWTTIPAVIAEIGAFG